MEIMTQERYREYKSDLEKQGIKEIYDQFETNRTTYGTFRMGYDEVKKIKEEMTTIKYIS